MNTDLAAQFGTFYQPTTARLPNKWILTFHVHLNVWLIIFVTPFNGNVVSKLMLFSLFYSTSPRSRERRIEKSSLCSQPQLPQFLFCVYLPFTKDAALNNIYELSSYSGKEEEKSFLSGEKTKKRERKITATSSFVCVKELTIFLKRRRRITKYEKKSVWD